MKFSILPNNLVDTEVKECSTAAEIGDLITKSRYAGGLFKDNYRKNENFLQTETIILDYDNAPDDDKLTLSQAENLFCSHRCLIAPTRNHRQEKKVGKRTLPAVDRFRVVLFLSAPITSESDYRSTWSAVVKQFPGADEACKDPARFLYPSSSVTYVNETGKLIDPVRSNFKQAGGGAGSWEQLPAGEYGELSLATEEFMRAGAPEGSWNRTLFKAAKDHQEQCYTEEEFIARAEKITGYLDSSDLSTIASAFAQPPKYGPRANTKEMPAVEKWTRNWIRSKELRVNYKTNLLTCDGKPETYACIKARVALDAKLWAEKNPIVLPSGKVQPRIPFGAEALEYVFTIWFNEQKTRTLAYYRDKLAYAGASFSSPLQDWLEATTGQCRPHDLAVMGHFIWQVKRKLWNLPVKDHIMPILVGKTGGGKTQAITRLLAPIEELLHEPQSMNVFEDERGAHVFGKFYVIFCDEMARVERINVDSLKNKITAATISYRMLGTNSTVSEKNVSTFIGASNRGVSELIKDSTSARRFWQIDCADELNWERINKGVNYLALWRAVDENSEVTPLDAVRTEVGRHQDRVLRYKNWVEQWLDENMEFRHTANWMTVNEALGLYREWCAFHELSNSGMTPAAFGKQLSSVGVDRKRTNTGSLYRVARMDAKKNGLTVVTEKNLSKDEEIID